MAERVARLLATVEPRRLARATAAIARAELLLSGTQTLLVSITLAVCLLYDSILYVYRLARIEYCKSRELISR
jgi:hypothetical protein